MARRGRNFSANTRYEAAFSKIDTMERAVVAHTVKVPFAVMDVVRMLLPEDKIKFLQQSFALLYLGHYPPSTYNGSLNCPGVGEVYVQLDVTACGLAVWKQEATCVNVEAPVYPAFIQTMMEIKQIHAQWDKVRAVVAYFKDHDASFGAVRNYWPSMGILLPISHKFHAFSGNGAFREPAGLGEMLELLRETAGIVSMAKFLPETSPTHRYTSFKVTVAGSHLFELL